MKIIMVSRSGDGGALAMKLREQRHDVKLLLMDEAAQKSEIYAGLLDRITELQAKLSVFKPETKPDLVFADMAKSGDLMDWFANKGIPTLGGGKLNDRLELERKYGVEMAEDCGIGVPEWDYAESYPEAIRKVKQFPHGVYVKFDGNQPTGSSEGFNTAEEMILWLENQERQKHLDPKKGVLVQEFVRGVLCSVEIWVTADYRAVCPTATMEEKAAATGGFGKKLGCAGNSVWRLKDDSPLLKATMLKTLPWLKKHGYPPGPLDGNFIITKDGPKLIEWSPRLGYCASHTQEELRTMKLGDFLLGVATGTVKEVTLRDGCASTIRCGIEPWPYESDSHKPAILEAWRKVCHDACYGVPIDGPVDEHCWLGDAMATQKGELACAGTSGCVFEISSLAESPEQANSQALAQIEEFHRQMRTLTCRIDTHARVQKDLATLKDWGLM